MFAIEIFMVARVMIAIVGEGCTAIGRRRVQSRGKRRKKKDSRQ